MIEMQTSTISLNKQALSNSLRLCSHRGDASLPAWVKAKFASLFYIALAAVMGFSYSQPTLAATTVDLAPVPMLALKSAPGLVMLTMSRDHRLFYAAYNEVTDLDGDGSLDVGFKESFTYYGYFDSNRCYKYDTSVTPKRFVPVSLAVAGTSNDQGCNFSGSTGRWHGNWLNWMTTSRMDALRKVLYGGARAVDNSSTTVLEASHVPADSHVWGKEFRPTNSSGTDDYLIQNYTPLAAPAAGKQHIFLMKSEPSTTSPYIGTTTPTLRVVTSVDANIDRIWLWASSERPVGGAAGTTQYTRQNGGNDKVINPTSTLISYGVPGFPNATAGGTSYGASSKTYTYNYEVRVEVCVNLSTGGRESGCTGYPSNAPTKYKPTGVLHDYGASDALKFGLLTGSYTNNYSGGVLRKDIGTFTDEYSTATGIFTSTNGIVKTIDALTTIGFEGGGTNGYLSNTTNSSVCPASFLEWNRLRCQGEIYMWGAPVGEMMYEGLRYFTDKQPLAAFTSGVSASTSPDSQLGLPLVSTWKNPFRPKASGGNPICSRPVQMVIADPITSFDSDQLPGAAFSPDTGRGTAIPATDIAGLNVSTEADKIWTAEFGASTTKNFFVGQSTSTNSDGNPSAKAATTFKTIRGHGPDETNTQGSYYAASVAKFARGTFDTDKIQLTGVKVGPTSATAKLTPVDTISVALGSVIPKFEISYGANKVSLVPFAKSVANNGGCTPAPSSAVSVPNGFQPTGLITGMFIDRIANTTSSNTDSSINSGRPFARFMVSFSDMDVGGDNEADSNAYYTTWIDGGGKFNVRMDPYNKATCIEIHMGYVISGTTKDGVYLDTRAKGSTGVKYYLDTPPGDDPAPSTGRTPGSVLSDTSSSRQFTLSTSGSTATYVPHDPLWYAAKYGGAGVIANGDPTNYFKVTNPATLPDQMGKAFRSAAALAAVASTSVVGVGQRSLGNAAIYQANYDSLTWSSRLYAFPISSSSVLANTPIWEVSSLIPTTPGTGAGKRANIYLGRGGSSTPVSLSSTGYTSLTAAEQADFGDASIYDYLRGVKSGEERNGGKYRNRGITESTNTTTTAKATATYGSVLGDIVNSDPQVISKKDYGYSAGDSTYTAFWTGVTDEKIAVGSNDGFFHIFDAAPTASGGGELLAFMPQAARSNIKDLASPGYQHRNLVDGAIGLGHAKISTVSDATVKWRSVAVAAGGDGAQTVFALDTTASTLNAGSVMWEINQSTSGVGTTLGNVMGRPAIGKLPNSGTWVAIFGNGYNSAAGTANLYVVKLSDGSVLQVIPTNTAVTGNGMGSAEIVRKTSGSADTIEYVYGADYKGNIWRYDLSSINASMTNWPTSGALIYSTPTGRPITGELKIGIAPTSPRTTGGKMIYFGTGSYLNSSDPTNTTVQSLYGIYDNLLHGLNATPYVTEPKLSVISITMAAGSDVRKTADAESPAWYTIAGSSSSEPGKKGWKVELTGTNVPLGERVIAPPVRYTVGGLIDAFLFTSVVPSTDDCEAGLDAWITGVDAMTGGYVKAFNSLDENSVRIRGGSPRGVFVLQDGASPTLYISQTIFNSTISTTSFSTGTGASQEVTINGVTGKTRIISIGLNSPAVTPSISQSVRQVWRQLK